MLAKNNNLHHNLMRIRHLSLQAYKPMSTATTAEPKVLFKDHTPSVFEFVLNAPKVLNSLDSEMCHLMLPKVK
jgi:hypothetical protein